MRYKVHDLNDISDDIFVHKNELIRTAIRKLESSAIKTLLVVNDSDQLEGTLTDGDVRRCLLKGHELETKVYLAMNTGYASASSTENFSSIKHLMGKNGLNHLPIIDERKKVQKIIVFDGLPITERHENDVLIMAGGEGRRLLPLTENCPKPMLFLNGKPMLEHVIDHCIVNGFTNFNISVNYLKEKIIEYFGDGSQKGIHIDYLEENVRLGTAGAIGLLKSETNFPIVVTNGDVLTSLNFKSFLEFHEQTKSCISIGACAHSTEVPFGVIDCSGTDFIGIREKPTINFMVSAGVYLIDKSMKNIIPKNKYFDAPDLFEAAKKQGFRVSIFPIHEKWIDVGLPETFEQASKEWL